MTGMVEVTTEVAAAREAIALVVGLIVGALGTVAVFRSSIAVLQTQVTALVTSVGSLNTKSDRHERDINSLAAHIREARRDDV